MTNPLRENETMTDRPSGSEMIEAERRRQVEKWTPGPWEVGERSTPPYKAGVFANQLLIAGVEDWPREKAEARANARLIAAAPTLYEALLAVLDTTMDARTAYNETALDARYRAVIALRLARGEEP